jgi:hypothetical protein
MHTPRYVLASCFCSDHRLWQTGCSWLGYDILSGQPVVQPKVAGLEDSRLRQLTRLPGQRGLQGPLLAPFRLAQPHGQAELIDQLRAFVRSRHSFTLPRLRLCLQGNAFCLRPDHLPDQLFDLAADCLRRFNRFRAPLSHSQLARGRAALLNAQEKHNLEHWGYPYVFNQFRFHATLTSRIIAPREKEIIYAALTERFAPVLDAPLIIDAIHLLVEPVAGAPLVLIDRFPFSAPLPALEPAAFHDPTNQDLHPGYQRHPA